LASASALHRTALPARTNSTQLSPVWYDPGDQPRLWANCTLRIYDELSHHLHLVGSVFNALLTLHHSVSFASLLLDFVFRLVLARLPLALFAAENG
jgi:hypothetical protein